ncbi:hypothetical protein ACFOD4_20910 [Pseudoroseomonas globiformis]|uniref:PilZ domain-containing protein n=1 Tax=Teichococcus globiformis TaxID=2307229 RepID=A0ABV7G794_9PROT
MAMQPGEHLIAISAQGSRLNCRNQAIFSLPFREREEQASMITHQQQQTDCRMFGAQLARGAVVEHDITDAAGFAFRTRTTAEDCARMARAVPER